MRTSGKKKSVNTSKKSSRADELSARIREVRSATFGPRGRARFARALGVSPSTYNYYERGRIPPMPILLKISDVSGVDLRWLLTGRLSTEQPAGARSPEHARILARMSALLPQRAEAAAALSALLDLLESQPEGAGQAQETQAGASDAKVHPSAAIRIPVLGRTAAGVPQFWKQHEPATVDLLRSALARGAASREACTVTLADPEETSHEGPDEGVHLVQLAKPVRIGELRVAEFLDCPMLRDRWPDAFALRLDGESMHPSLSHGDLVILSPRERARAGRAAVVQLRNQIGVTCKLFRTDNTHVHLIPINEQFRPTKHPLEDLVWALAVLYRVRLVERV